MSEYREVGRSTRNGLTISRWRPWKGEVAEFRDFLLKPGFGGTDYGLDDDELARYIARAKAKVGGRRLSWHVLALDAIRLDHGAEAR